MDTYLERERETRLKILIVGLNFAPELTGVGKYTGEMAAWLAARGHAIKVITTRPYYPEWKVVPGEHRTWQGEQWQGCQIVRCPLYVPRSITPLRRIAHLSSFAAGSIPPGLWQIASERPDIVCSIVPTLLTAPLALGIARLTGARAWLHFQDLEVDAAGGVDFVRSNVALKAAFSLERALLKRFDLVSAVSQKMVDAIGRKGVRADRLMLFPNWVDTSRIFPTAPSSEMRRDLGIPDGACVALYSGSLGRKQGLEHVIAAARLLATTGEPSPVFAIAGAGPARRELEQQASGLANVIFLPLQPEDRLNAFLNLADIHLLPQRRNATDLVMPSKLGAMLATGRPVIATVPDDSQIAEVVRGAGMVVPPENAAALATAIRELSRNANYRHMLGSRGPLKVRHSIESEFVLRNTEHRLLKLSQSHSSDHKAQATATLSRRLNKAPSRERTPERAPTL